MSYIATSTGKHIDFVNITPDQICIEDIARGLSNECRFAGQLESFYSVAQHSVYVSQIVPPEYALEALLHDAAEAYIKDIPSPLKAMLPDYKAMEKHIEAAIREKFGLTIVELGRNAGIDPKKDFPFVGEAHNALDDALHQVNYVVAIHQHLLKSL